MCRSSYTNYERVVDGTEKIGRHVGTLKLQGSVDFALAKTQLIPRFSRALEWMGCLTGAIRCDCNPAHREGDVRLEGIALHGLDAAFQINGQRETGS